MNEMERLLVDARAKLVWGEPVKSVRQFLGDSGMVSDKEILRFVKKVNAEKKRSIRGEGVASIVRGVPLFLLPVGMYILYQFYPDLRILTGRIFDWVARLGLYGFYKIADGLWKLVTAKSDPETV
ncbi:MAG: hypothetical protein AAFX93_15015 [Verrucomicrobiota bacterium]